MRPVGLRRAINHGFSLDFILATNCIRLARGHAEAVVECVLRWLSWIDGAERDFSLSSLHHSARRGRVARQGVVLHQSALLDSLAYLAGIGFEARLEDSEDAAIVVFFLIGIFVCVLTLFSCKLRFFFRRRQVLV